MDKSKNNKAYILAYVISFLIVLLIFSFFIYKKNQDEITRKKNEIINVNKLINTGKYDNVIENIEKKGTGGVDRIEKMKLVASYLNYGNYFYKEEENSQKAMEILNTMVDDHEVLFYKGYAKEIIRDYTGALDCYNKGLLIKDLFNSKKSLLLNQVGHVYDLKGEFDKVFKYYDEAYKLDNKNASALSNLGRYYARTGDFVKANDFLIKAVDLTKNLPLKSEIYFSLSSIELELNGYTPNIDKSIEYSKKSIEAYPDYSMGYVALARGLYMKNDKKNNKEIEENLDKALELNPNSYYAYDLYAMHEFDKGNYDKTFKLFEKALDSIDNDTILMNSERGNNKLVLNFKYHIFNEIQKNLNNNNEMFLFLEKIIPIDVGRTILKQQIQREQNGILSSISKDEKFKKLKEDLIK